MKAMAFLAALLVGVFVTAYGPDRATIDDYLHTGHLHAQDWLLLIFGSLLVGGVGYTFLTQPDSIDWSGSFWLIVGGVMIYAALGDVPWLKDASCWIVNAHHYGSWSYPCYQ